MVRWRLTVDGVGMQVRWRDGTTRSCLVPVVGLLNHTRCAHVHRYSRLGASSGALRLQTSRACLPGEQLTLSYGPLSNAKLLLFYGFMLDDNPFDVLPVSLALDEDDPLCDAKAARLQAHGASGKRAWVKPDMMRGAAYGMQVVAGFACVASSRRRECDWYRAGLGAYGGAASSPAVTSEASRGPTRVSNG
jgi:hypothetical protein